MSNIPTTLDTLLAAHRDAMAAAIAHNDARHALIRAYDAADYDTRKAYDAALGYVTARRRPTAESVYNV